MTKRLFFLVLSAVLPLMTCFSCSKEDSPSPEPVPPTPPTPTEEFTYINVQYKKSMSVAAWSNAKTLTVDGMNLLEKRTESTFDRWGGLDGIKPDIIVSKNTPGYWRTGKYRGRWVMVNPDGNVTILHGVNGVTPDPNKVQTTARTQELFNNRFKSISQWSIYANEVLVDYGFNFITANGKGGNTDEVYRYKGNTMISEVKILSMLNGFTGNYKKYSGISFDKTVASNFTLMFDPGYETYLDNLAKENADEFKNRKHFIGYYIDNELQFRYASESSGPGIFLKTWLVLPEGSTHPRAFRYAKAYAENFMKDRYKVEPKVENITPEMEEAFLMDISEYYYRTTSEAIRKNDPNHLVMGSRIHGKPKTLPQVHLAGAKYCDILSINVYSVWEPNDDYFIDQYKPWVAECEKPFLVTEFYTRDSSLKFKGESYANDGEGGGWIVPNQKSRGQYYQNFTRKLLSYNQCIGWQWFQFTDDDYKTYGWNNKGLIAPDYSLYKDHLNLMRQLHWNIYQIMDYYSPWK